MSNTPITVWLLGDQLLRAHPAIEAVEAQAGRRNMRIVLVESDARIAQMPYQRKKIVLILSAMRHYAASLRERGYLVDEVRAPSFVAGLQRHVAQHRSQRLVTMAAAEYATRRFQQDYLSQALGIQVEVLPNTQFLTGRRNPFPDVEPSQRVIMERFYRAMRRHFDVLLEPDGSPTGGAWNFDRLNRRRLPRSV
ncbi:MAG: cryptochrome/photolyase family protein, partial [Roseiflexus castenholzii]